MGEKNINSLSKDKYLSNIPNSSFTKMKQTFLLAQTTNNLFQSDFAEHRESHFLCFGGKFFHNTVTFSPFFTSSSRVHIFISLRDSEKQLSYYSGEQLVSHLSQGLPLPWEMCLWFSEARSPSCLLLAGGVNQEASSIWNSVLIFSCCKKQTGLFITMGVRFSSPQTAGRLRAVTFKISRIQAVDPPWIVNFSSWAPWFLSARQVLSSPGHCSYEMSGSWERSSC